MPPFMTPQNDLTAHALQALRRQGSVLSSADLQRLLGVSQPTVSRALAPLIQSGQVQKMNYSTLCVAKDGVSRGG